MKRSLFSVLLMGLLSLIITACSTGSDESIRFYVGTYASADKPGIYSCELDLKQKQINVLNATFGIDNPSFLALSPDQSYLYAVSEVDQFANHPIGSVSAFRVNEDLSLKLINTGPSGGAHPCHLEVHPSGKMLFVANYTGGNVICMRVKPNGELDPGIFGINHIGSGPNTERQSKAHAHSANITENGLYMFACDLGMDKIVAYRVDLAKGMLISHDPGTVEMAPGAGPRHMDFTPDNHYAFVINELNSTVTSLSMDEHSGKLKLLSSVSTLPVDFSGQNYCADIHVHPNGKFVYGSNRGHNSIAVFRIGDQGSLKLVQTQSTGGDWPRNFAIDSTGKYLIVANQKSGNIVVLKIDEDSGELSETGIRVDIPAPVCILPKNRD